MIQIITRMLSVISLLLGGLILIKGNPFMGGQKLTMGELIAFTQYVGGMIWPIEMLGWLTNGVASAKASKCSPTIIKYLGITLFPQAGVALGMAIKAVESNIPDWEKRVLLKFLELTDRELLV